MSTSDPRVIATLNTRLIPNRPGDTPFEIPRDLPGVVIFLHGVNDPGAAYESVEQGLCQGLNERLSRPDMAAEPYGVDYAKANETSAEDRREQQKDYIDDPDTYLYKRSAGGEKPRSVFIPFYWGYRAAPDEIQRDRNGDPTKLRTQYQDLFGNRLDRHFAKGGGFFANATNNLPEMYGEGFDKFVRHAANRALPNMLYMGESPHRRYFVLAAHRLAMLISEIRRVSPNETVTVMGHSQGTLITLLAQALLVDRGERCADCVIMVASPYSLLPGKTPEHSKTLDTLIDIVTALTCSPHAQPPLSALQPGMKGYGGRTGSKWSAEQGQRLGPDQSTVVFPERDNRGKVYLYFSHDDTTVALRDVSGIGTFGVPDTLPDGTPAMDRLKDLRFHQRLWSKRLRDNQPVPVGAEPCWVELRTGEERRSAGHNPLVSFATEAGMDKGELRFINAEALTPSHAPQMFGGEAITGTPDTPGKDKPDAVAQNTALGKSRASFEWRYVDKRSLPINLIAARDGWNKGKDPDDQTRELRQREVTDIRDRRVAYYMIEREETPNEIRERMSRGQDGEANKEWDANSYHSAILRSPENHRWVTAMDVAIGQARCLDDRDMREVLIAIADWRIDEYFYTETLVTMPGWARLSQAARTLVDAIYLYYHKGQFPSEGLVPMSPPSLVHHQRKEGKR
jgi:pimeloyl-ACP methyl ester carboxylesterase